MKRRIQVFAPVILIVALVACSRNNLSLFGAPSQTQTEQKPAPSPSASPTPSATPIKIDSSCTATCNIHSIVLDEGANVIELLREQVYNMTPFTEVNICDENGKPTQNTKLVKTTEDCDNKRAGEVRWSSSTNALQVSGDGFRAVVKRVGTGESVLTVSLQGKTYSRVIR